MYKFRLVPAGVAALTSAMLLANSLVAHSQPAIDVSTNSLAPSGVGAGPASMPAGADFADYFSGSETVYIEETTARASSKPLAGLLLASSEPDMSPMFAPMLTLYSQLLALNGSSADGISWQRLKARLANAAVADKTGLLTIDDVLAAELDSVELLAIDVQRLQDLGVSDADIKRLPALTPLVDSVKSAMMELPQGLARFKGPVAIAVWGQEASKPELVSLLVRAD